MIKRTAQEWADFTGCELRVYEYVLYAINTDFWFSVDKCCVSDFETLIYNQIINPSEPCTLVPDRELQEIADSTARITALLADVRDSL